NCGREQITRAETVGRPATGYLKDGIAENECAEDPAHRLRAERKFVLNIFSGDAQVQAVEIGEHQDEREPAHDGPANPRGFSSRLCACDLIASGHLRLA